MESTAGSKLSSWNAALMMAQGLLCSCRAMRSGARARLFQMVLSDPSRRKAAFSVLGQVEVCRIEHGCPNSEPRHPMIEAGEPWPPISFLRQAPVSPCSTGASNKPGAIGWPLKNTAICFAIPDLPSAPRRR
jgi:hypothetical protein